MSPKETVLNAINDYLKDNLISEGFKFSESQLSFNRRLKNGFLQKIKFTANLRNYTGEMIRYGEQYLVSSTRYKNWWIENFPNVPVLGAGILNTDHSAFINSDNNLKFGNEYEFYNTDPKQIMNLIWSNYVNHGKVFFEQNESWEKLGIVADSHYAQIDALIQANLLERAYNLAVNTKKEYLEYYGSEEKMRTEAGQTINIIDSRIEYLNKKGYQKV